MINRFIGKYEPFSNFWVLSSPIILPEIIGPADNYYYFSVEGAYQAAKTLDPAIRFDISKMRSSKAKAKGKTLILRPDWESVKRLIMLDLVRQKFYNSHSLATLLAATEDRTIIEGNYWHDNYWGDCSCEQCQHIEGKNWLGKIIMHVRKELVI